jgi:hypothetical protein
MYTPLGGPTFGRRDHFGPKRHAETPRNPASRGEMLSGTRGSRGIYMKGNNGVSCIYTRIRVSLRVETFVMDKSHTPGYKRDTWSG